MVNELKVSSVHCPYCGERIEALLDCSVPAQTYTEDCQVCCRPIVFNVSVVDEIPLIIVSREDD